MPDLELPLNASIEDILDRAYLEVYEKAMQFFYLQLSDLHVNLYLIEKITSFPHELFLDAFEKAVFLSCFVNNAIDMSFLIEMRLLDSSGDLYTFTRFSNKVQENVKDEYKKAFKKYRDAFKIQDKEINGIREELRHSRIAHLKSVYKEQLEKNTLKATHLYLPEIKEICDKLTAHFNYLAFSREYVFLPRSYRRPDLVTYKSDIEEVLDGIARNSDILNLPETNQEQWQTTRLSLTQKEIEHLNSYRKKLGIIEI